MQSPLKAFLASFILLFAHVGANAQKTEKLTFSLPQKKVANSLYNKIKLIDVRADTTNMGMIQTGAFNKPTAVVAKEPLANQLNNILAALTDDTAKPQELAIQLRRISFTEETGGFSEKGYFFLSAQLYAKTSDGYKRISTIDTTATVGSGMDVSNALLKKGGETLSKFIAENLTRQPSNFTYSFNEVEKVDSIEKSKLPIYNTNTYIDGYYSTYTSFSNQVPDGQITVEGEKVRPGKVKVPDDQGKLRKLKPLAVYAIVYKGKPYMVNEFGYYPISKSGNDFYFTGKLAQGAKASVMASGMMFGAIGGALAGAAASAYSDQIYEVKIHYLKGEFIRLREAKAAVVD
jgi:hypothetical protein